MSKAKAYDLAAAAPFILLFAFALGGLYLQVLRETATQAPSLQLLLWIGSKLVAAVFIGFQIVLFVIRRLPLAMSPGWLPRIVAAAGSSSATLFLALPPAPPSESLSILSSLLTITGTAGAIVAIGYLGRSFSIMPQARGLVSRGPYRRIRHPLYLAEQVASLGIMLQYRQPWSLLAFAAGLLLQIPRIHYEEEVLSDAFPAYRAYIATVTTRLIPGVY